MKNNLYEMRKAAKVSQDTLAAACNVSRQTIISIEKERYNPSISLAIAIARYFCVSVEDIFSPFSGWRLFDNDFDTASPEIKANYEHNAALDIDGMIYGQGLPNVRDGKYGKYKLSLNGGEPIAVYNAMRLLGQNQPLCEIIAEFELNRMPLISGLAGTDPRKLGLYFDGHGVHYTQYADKKQFEKSIKAVKGIFVLSVAGAGMIASARALHTVCGEYDGERILLYNADDYEQTAREYGEFSQLPSINGFICGYVFEG